MGDGSYDADVAGGGDEWCSYEDGLLSGTWTTRDHQSINVGSMSLQHLRGARRVAERAAERATFSNIEEMWLAWVELLDDEIFLRERKQLQKKSTQPPKSPPEPPRGKMVQMICHCGTEYPARAADLKRGWGYSCSKRCAAIRRDFGRPKAKRKPASNKEQAK